MDLDAAAETLWRSIEHGVHDPPALRGALTLDHAYAIQLRLLARHEARGERLAGWKVGLTARAIQQQLGFHEPVMGYLLRSGQRSSPAAFAHAELISPAIENELCLTVGEALRGPGVTLQRAAAAISQVAPALEVVERRQRAPMDFALTMADSAQQKAFVCGEPIAYDGRDLARVPVDVFVDGAWQERALGAEVMGNPVASLAWLANTLARFGRSVEAGAHVMSGSFTRQYGAGKGSSVEARFEGVGSVSASFA